MIVRELVTLLGFRNDDAGARAHERTLDRVRHKAESVAGETASTMQNAMRAVYAALAGGAALMAVKGITDAADTITTAMNRITAALQGQDDPAAVFERIYASARETGSELGLLTAAFMRFAAPMRDAGHDAGVTVDMLTGLQKGLLAAGSSAAEAAGVMTQLGQAMTKGKFDGDELKNFLENASPTLVDTFAAALGTTRDKLSEMGSEGKLVATNVIPALIEAAKAGANEFDAMERTVALAGASARVSMTRFLGEFGKSIGLTQVAIKWIDAFGRRLDRWRESLPALRDIVEQIGGLERILQTVAVAIGLGTALWLAYNRAALVAALRTAAAFAPWILGGIAVAAVAALIMDFVEWVGGEDVDTLFRRWFGPFEDVAARFAPEIETLRTAWEAFRTMLGDGYVALAAAGEQFWPAFVEYLRVLWRTMDEVGQGIGLAVRAIYEATLREFTGVMALWETLKAGWQSGRDVFAQVAEGIANLLSGLVGNFIAGFGTIIGWIDRAKAALLSWLGMGGAGGAAAPQGTPGAGDGPRRGTLAPFSPAPGDAAFRQEMGNLLNLAPAAGPLAGAIGASGSGATNQTQANTIQNNVTVTATGASAPEVAAGVNQGMSRATDGMVNSLREVQAGMPLTEAPAQ